MSDVVKRDLYGLIDKELEAANQKFPLFNSTHEAFAVILEEAEEAKEEAGNLDILMNNFWIGVKENHDPEALHEELTGIYKTALDLAVEAEILIEHLKEQQAAGARLILWINREGDLLEEAVEWCKARGLTFDTVNANLPELIDLYKNDCRKINADIYIDDKAEFEKRSSNHVEKN